MLWSWRDWRLPHVRWVYAGVYIVALVLAVVLGAGVWSALIAAAIGAAAVGPLELWYRQRHPARPADH
jgi:CBS-domain-containing membrane protein